jgi:CBS domain-containing protein
MGNDETRSYPSPRGQRGIRLVGLLSHRDLGGVRGDLVRAGRTVAELMTPGAVTVTPTETLRKAANLMREGRRLTGGDRWSRSHRDHSGRRPAGCPRSRRGTSRGSTARAESSSAAPEASRVGRAMVNSDRADASRPKLSAEARSAHVPMARPSVPCTAVSARISSRGVAGLN